MKRRKTVADWSAGALAVIVLALGGLVVVKPAVDHWDDLYRGDPFQVGRTTQTVKRERAGKPIERTTTTTKASASLVERVLGNSGLLLLRLTIAVLAAFLAAAVLHRAILGNYGFRAGRMQSPTLAAASGYTRQRRVGTSGDSSGTSVSIPNGRNTTEEATGVDLAPSIGKLVAARREELGLSQRELAKRAGMSHTVISRLESGQQAPSPKTLERLTEAFRAVR